MEYAHLPVQVVKLGPQRMEEWAGAHKQSLPSLRHEGHSSCLFEHEYHAGKRDAEMKIFGL